jgi:RNA polymerase sigma-70 factor (ECF subfamily)
MGFTAVQSLDEVDAAGADDLTAEALAARHLSRVHRFAVMVTPHGADPEDLAQQAMLKALEALDRFDPSRGTPDAWLWRIVVNVAHDAGRLRRGKERLVERLVAHERSTVAMVSPETLALNRLQDDELIAAVRRLPPRYRRLIALRYGAGLGSAEVARLLGTTRMAVAKATRRALDRLRTDLTERGFCE